ncbi:MAG TPA: hypothetical protein VK771_02905, partial [Acidimicrobiia bacterium]|nr:hypothetical protein [Acidimicrobiia bacterium]
LVGLVELLLVELLLVVVDEPGVKSKSKSMCGALKSPRFCPTYRVHGWVASHCAVPPVWVVVKDWMWNVREKFPLPSDEPELSSPTVVHCNGPFWPVGSGKEAFVLSPWHSATTTVERVSKPVPLIATSNPLSGPMTHWPDVGEHCVSFGLMAAGAVGVKFPVAGAATVWLAIAAVAEARREPGAPQTLAIAKVRRRTPTT